MLTSAKLKKKIYMRDIQGVKNDRSPTSDRLCGGVLKTRHEMTLPNLGQPKKQTNYMLKLLSSLNAKVFG